MIYEWIMIYDEYELFNFYYMFIENEFWYEL